MQSACSREHTASEAAHEAHMELTTCPLQQVAPVQPKCCLFSFALWHRMCKSRTNLHGLLHERVALTQANFVDQKDRSKQSTRGARMVTTSMLRCMQSVCSREHRASKAAHEAQRGLTTSPPRKWPLFSLNASDSVLFSSTGCVKTGHFTCTPTRMLGAHAGHYLST